MRVLIFSAYYWPEFSGTAPYVTAPAEYLAASGYQVDVVAAFPHYPQWRELQKRTLTAHETVNEVDIYRQWHTIPSVQSARSRAVYEASMLGFGSRALISVPPPDIIVGVTPALASASLAYAASKRFRKPYGLVVHDLMGRGAQQSGVSDERVGKIIERAELRLAHRASRLLVLADAMKAFFVDGGVDPAQIDVAPTWTLRAPPPIDRDSVRRSVGWSDNDFICLHGGNLGQKQGLDNVVDAAALMQAHRSAGVRVVLVGDGNDRRRLEDRVLRMGLRNLEFLPMQPVDRYDELVAAADVLLLNQRASLADMSLPSKLSAYFAAGRPVVAAVSRDSPAGVEVERSGAGVVVDPSRPEALAAGLEALRKDSDRLEHMGASGRRFSENALSADVILPQYRDFVNAIGGTHWQRR